MMTPRIGMFVYHYADPGSDPCAALITAVGVSNRLALDLFRPGFATMECLDGVPHLSEHGTRPVDEETGYWDFVSQSDETAKIKKALATAHE